MSTTPATGHPLLPDESAVDRYVREVSDTIHDPCAMAMGVALGMDEMGLIRDIQIKSLGDVWSVHIVVRLTSPGCDYYFAFKDNLEQRLERHPQIGALSVEWDPTLDWTPSNLTPKAQERLDQRRRELWSGKTPRRGAEAPGVIRLQAS
jgi:metal-sulfur cluster biosynthetic enzyme